ncbi:hypothetical protein CC80DRAFT_496400 [Byssothecium circinans]|uniref:Uncharacterized protein n=1 Tax=Byssothecium circinans TaxID=147558 RepID=A0A6A5TG13_9PLEO|nr:hypothetical protein CC80DRAFT_496400 [Byssothecium circinans]
MTSSPSPKTLSKPLDPTIHSKITEYIASKPNFNHLIGKHPKDPQFNPWKTAPPPAHLPADLLKAFDELKIADMPVHPAEEHATGNITDKVAKESSDSTASEHKLHDEDTGATSGGSLHANAHKANPVHL